MTQSTTGKHTLLEMAHYVLMVKEHSVVSVKVECAGLAWPGNQAAAELTPST